MIRDYNDPTSGAYILTLFTPDHRLRCPNVTITILPE